MTERKYRLIKRQLEKVYNLLTDNDVISNKKEYAEIKVKTKAVLAKFKRNYLYFTRESRK